MEIKQLLEQFNQIQKALALCIGTLSAFCEQQNGNQSCSSGEEKTQTPTFTKIGDEKTMFRITDTQWRYHKGTYEVLFRKFGIKKSCCGKTLELAQDKMRKYLHELNKTFKPRAKKGHSVDEWNDVFLYTYKKPKLAEQSFKNYEHTYRCYIKPEFGHRDISEIKTLELQKFLVGFVERGNARTAEQIKVYLNGLFGVALKNEIILKNPVDAVDLPKHYRKHGTALTMQEEETFISRLNEVAYFKKSLLFLLYSGARVSEAVQVSESDIDYEKNLLTIHTTKQKDRVNAKPRIVPIFPKLRAVLDMPGKLNVDAKKVSSAFKKICPEHHLHELRHTFTSRCRECGIDLELTSLWTGHTFAGNTTSLVYTHFSYEFQQQQAKKLDY